ncbi:Mga helix-turn-helix domain [Clostridium perfringens]|uniref:Mga helix-turn-helix domain n=2 Tax=Clostridium perfringens TaxID=1502 RepID=A0A2X3IFJ0_CLOPF|nr:M protein transactivating positive regulator MGA [Clostridium perfringens]ELC8420254.1 helix-turn-helix domain-containing protein [Clostridium perfringens]ELC8440666.1 helix-turn-helix domain-containing protein [Clostridium perfringens]MDG6893756.1 Mga helix-turn-helix domain protein [Clostridium perfringens]PWX28849.1 M protein trans-acting positive regulator (MGA) [Clostridium perfringens]
MFKEDLLEKSEKLQFKILKKIYLNNGRIAKYELCNTFNISPPTLKSHIEKIDFLLKDNYHNKVQITYSKNDIILKYENYINLEQLMSSCIKKSLKYKLLRYLFENSNNLSSGIKICNELNISLSTLNRKIFECNCLLKEFDINIKNYRLEGSQSQIYYFFYSLFIVTGTVSTNSNFLFNKLINFFNKKFKISFNIKQKYSLYVWTTIINNRKFFFKKEFFNNNFYKDNIKKLNNNVFFLELKTFFEKNYFNKNIGEYISFMTICFILSFDLFPIDFIFNNIEFKNNMAFKTYKLIFNQINELYISPTNNFNNTLKCNLLSICYKQYFFKGILYSNDYITTNHYLSEFSSYSRKKFVENLLLKIHNSTTNYHIDDEYFKFCVILTLNYINGNTKYPINIGVLSQSENLTLSSTINDLNNALRKKFDVIVEIYDENKKRYDLVITNFNINFKCLVNNCDNIYFFTNLGIKYDLENIIKLLDKIEEKK